MKFCSSFSLFVFNMLHIMLVGCCQLLVDDSPVISLVVFTLYRYVVFRFIVSCFLLCASAVNFCFVVFVRVVTENLGLLGHGSRRSFECALLSILPEQHKLDQP